MEKANTAERLREILEIKNWKQVDMLTAVKPTFDKYDMKISKQAISQYLQGKVEPKQNVIFAFAEAFGVSEVWLMGFDVSMNKLPAPVTSARAIKDNTFMELYEKYILLNDEQKKALLIMIDSMIK